MIRIYNVLRKIRYLSSVEETALPEGEAVETEPEENAGLNKALDTYRKLIEKKDGADPLTEKEQEDLENKIKEIEEREVVEKVEEHEQKRVQFRF